MHEIREEGERKRREKRGTIGERMRVVGEKGRGRCMRLKSNRGA